MKTIDTLVPDIQKRITSNEPFNEADVVEFGNGLGVLLAERLSRGSHSPSLRLSNLGTPCDRKLWYSINRPELGESLGPSARLKFLFGDILEHLLLFLARAAGHSVTHEQQEVDLHGVTGHIDAVIDGELVDCKSASTFSFKKFRDHGLVTEDAFGYRTQLNGYLSSLTDGEHGQGVNKDRAHFLAVDKTLGNICLDTHPREDVDYEELVKNKRDMLAWPTPPERGYKDEQETYYRKPTGNRKLGVSCSYCPFKKECWPGLRAFVGGGKPTFYTNFQKLIGDKREVSLDEATED